MEDFASRARHLLRDLDPDFVEAVSIALAWEYDSLFERIRADDAIPNCVKEEEFNRRRGDCAVHAVAGAAKRYGVPFEFHRLRSNGQYKLIVKAGRVIIIQEPIAVLGQRPTPSDYKVELADTHGFVRQLELDLGDRPGRIRDWSGCILGVLLHGSVGARFEREQKSLGVTMLGIPDASYSQWIMRIDLQDVAMFGRGHVSGEPERTEGDQEDLVIVTSKKRNDIADVG